MPVFGLNNGIVPIVAYNYGAKNATRVVKTFRLLLISCLIYSFTLGMCVMFFPRAFAAMFTTDAALLGFTERVIRIYFGGIFFFGIQIACQMTFVSTGNAPCSIIVAIVRKFVLLLPLIYLMPQLIENKTMGVYLAEPVADVIAVTFTAVLFAIQFRKSLKKLSTDEASAQ